MHHNVIHSKCLNLERFGKFESCRQLTSPGTIKAPFEFVKLSCIR